MRIGILGGSFNPVHRGHLKLAREALTALHLDKILFVPTRQTPLKAREALLPAPLRVRLLKRAVRPFPRFEISNCEVRRKGPSYTVDTLRYLKRRYGPDTALYFLTGSDASGSLRRWKSWKRILRLSRFVVFARPGFPVRKKHPSVIYLPLKPTDIAASRIRSRLASGKPVGHWLPPGTAGPLKKYFKKRKR